MKQIYIIFNDPFDVLEKRSVSPISCRFYTSLNQIKKTSNSNLLDGWTASTASVLQNIKSLCSIRDLILVFYKIHPCRSKSTVIMRSHTDENSKTFAHCILQQTFK